MASADRLIEIFNEAKAQPVGPERDGLLAESCGADAELKEQVIALLRAHENAGAFLQAGPTISPEIEAELARLKPEEAGERIGPYKLREQIGEGGFGVVWVAEQQEPVRRTVALKIIKLGMDTREVVARFEQERQALAMMDHPNIARVLDAGATQHGRPFFVMELVRGIKITDYCDQANLPTAERLALFIQVCNAVQHAHQKGIIHRDLKPSNILVTLHDGVPVPKVIDFGVAKATQQQRLTDLTVYTQFQQMIGTPLYMSPEQAEMSGLDIDTRSDIYSLGVLLYELLTGGTPFDPKDLMKQGLDEIRRTIREVEPQTPSMFLKTMADETRATVARHRHADPAKLTKLVRGDLDWIVMKALEKDRRRRYETAKGLADDIERHLSSEPVLARPVSQLYRFRRLVKRNKLTFAAAGAVSIALLLALLILSVSTMRIVKERNQKNLALSQKGVALEEKGAALADAKVQLFSSLLNQARALRISGQMGQRVGSLQALSEAARIRPDERLRDEAIAAMALSDLRVGPEWNVEERGVSEFRPRTVTDDEGTITIRTLPEPAVIQRIETGRKGGGVLISDDGRFLAQYGWNQGLRIWRVADKQSVLHGEPVGTRGGAFSSDSRFFAFGQEKQILYFDLTTGEEKKLSPLPAPPRSFSFRPDNRQLAVGYLYGDVVSIFDTVAGSKYADLPVGGGGSRIVKWHPDGRRIAIGQNNIQLWDVPAKRRSETLAGHATGLSDFCFHPDGRIVASMGRGATICRLWELSSGRQLLETLNLEGPFAFSPDGKWLGSIGRGKDRRLLEVELSREYRTIARLAGTDGDLAPDGRLLAMAMRDGVRIWDITNGRELAFLAIGPTQSTFFQPDGRELLTCGDRGLLRWPLQNGENGANQLRLGPPQTIWLPFKPHTASLSKDGRTLAVGREEGPGTLIVDLATGSVSGSLFSTVSQQLKLSPDGHLLATVSFRTSQAWLWDVRTGKEVMKWDERWIKRITFTPDSQTILVSHYDAVSFVDVHSFREIRRLPRRSGKDDPGKVVFSQDGKLSAIEVLPGVISLIEVSTGRTVAQLTSPYRYHDRASWMCFDPEGAQLIAASQFGIHVWDLRAIRVRLKMMGLDWDWPELPMTAKATESRSPISPQIESIEILDRVLPPEPSSLAKMGLLVVQELEAARYSNDANKATFFFAAVEQLEAYYRTQGRFAEAVPLLAEMSASAPQNSKLAERVCALQAWLGQDAGHGTTCRRMLGSAAGTNDPDIPALAAKGYCLRPSSDPQLMKTALTLAERAVDLGKQNPNLHDHQLALGLAQYRHGDYAASEKTLSSAERTGSDKVEVNYLARFFRAMSLFRQDKRVKAHKLFTETAKVMTPLPADERDVLSEKTITSQIIIWLAYKEAKALLESATKL